MNEEKLNQENEATIASLSPTAAPLVRQILSKGHVPDILTCIANLSSDEVFTPPELVDKMLDIFPEEVWHDSSLRWLDPACKTGIFLRQIAKRLMEGLRDEFPDEEARRQHIFKNMLYGIAITGLTALMSRRSLYTSKNASGDKSIAKFDTENGNISYDNRPHTYKNGACIYCGNKEGGELDRDENQERHAYNFIHLKPEEIKNMKFDVIVGNPPYQLSDGGFGASAMPIYQLFVEQAKKLNPRYLAFIIPSRWFAGGRGLDSFRDEMLKDRHIRTLVDFPNSSDCFPGVDIMGGVCYFVRDNTYEGKCRYIILGKDEILSETERYLDDGDINVLIRYPEMVSVLNKVKARNEETVDSIISSQRPFGLRTDFFKNPKKYGFPDVYENKNDVKGASIKVYGLLNGKRRIFYAPLGFPFTSSRDQVNKFKVFISSAYGSPAVGENGKTQVIGEPILAPQLSACTETFLSAGGFDSEDKAKNFYEYMKTKFFRFLVSIKKTTQHTSKDTYSLVPLLNLNEEWTDKKLYERYELDQNEIDFIENNIKEMA